MSALVKTLVARAFKEGARPVEALADGLEDLLRVARFARGRLELRVRPDDLFIVTYPRSGTTLMQFMVYQLVSGRGLDFDHISQVVPWFERSLAVGALEASDLEAMASPRLFKSHLAHLWIPRGARYIYITRDGRDVAVSYYHFYRSHLRYQGTFDQFYRRFLRGDVQYGSWFKHTAGWRTHRSAPNILFIRFEDLVHALPSCIEEVAGFLGVPASPGRVEAIARRCSFDRMKQHEPRFDFTTELVLQRGYQQGRFLRSGRTGEGTNLQPGQERAFQRLAARQPWLAGLELDLSAFLH